MTVTNNRKAKRQSVTYGGMIYSHTGDCIAQCKLRNISATGAQLELQKEMELPSHFVLSLSFGGEVRRRCGLVWQFSTVVGVRFANDE